MKLSEKKKSELYSVVHEEIMQARIKIARFLNNNRIRTDIVDEVDNTLSKLTIKAPQKAIDFFK